MPTTRTDIAHLPAALRDTLEERTGPLLKVEPVTEGWNSEIAALVHGDAGSVFVKGLREDHPRAWTQRREAEIAPYVLDVAPALLWQVRAEGWHLLGFEALAGHHADYAPGSPDLPAVSELLSRLGDTPRPAIELREAAQRLSGYVDSPDALEMFAGDALLHTDLNPANVLVDVDERARLVDWAWATRGAAWLDAGYWVVWLVATGHSPQSAEAWASEVPAWATAPREGVDAFAAANARLWHEIADADPDQWTNRLCRAAEAWAEHRTAVAAP